MQGIAKQMLNYNCCQLVIFNTDNCTSLTPFPCFRFSLHLSSVPPLLAINLLSFYPFCLSLTTCHGLCDFLVAYFGEQPDCCCQLMFVVVIAVAHVVFVAIVVVVAVAYVFAMIKLYFQFISLSLSTGKEQFS